MGHSVLSSNLERSFSPDRSGSGMSSLTGIQEVPTLTAPFGKHSGMQSPD